MTYTVTKIWSLVKVMGNGTKPDTKVFVGMYGTKGEALAAAGDIFHKYVTDAEKVKRLVSSTLIRTEVDEKTEVFSFKYETENATVRKVKLRIESYEIKES